MSNLRIIGGIYKNRLIRMNPKHNIRPTSIRARQMIFDTLIYRLPENFTFLDVFAGAGAMGIEALSRGAEMVTFFDINKDIVKNIEKNLKTMDKINGTYNILLANALKPPVGRPVDCVFIDPPYLNASIINDVLKRLNKNNWINENTIIVIEHSKKFQLELPENFVLWKTTKISHSIIDFFHFQ